MTVFGGHGEGWMINIKPDKEFWQTQKLAPYFVMFLVCHKEGVMMYLLLALNLSKASLTESIRIVILHYPLLFLALKT